jgi:excisionase family DNA binding protein
MEDNQNFAVETYNIQQVAEKMKVSDRTIRRLVDSGRFPKPIRLGRGLRWPHAVITEFLQQQAKHSNG